MKIIIVVALFLLNCPLVFGQQKGKLRIIMQGFRNNNGMEGIRVFDHADGFPSEKNKALKEFYVSPVNGEAVLELSEFNYGTYAIGCIHDENNSKELDRNFIGIPKEGFGTSNNPKALFGPPSFKEAKFELREEIHVLIIKMVYF